MISTHGTTHTLTQSDTSTGNETEATRSVLTTVFAVDRMVAATSAVVLTLGGFWIADRFAWPGWVMVAIGVGLAPYAYLLHVVVRDGLHRSALAKLTAAGDAAWVIGSAALLLGWPDATSTAGTWVTAIMALVVADIGLTKMYGWRHGNKGDDGATRGRRPAR